MNPNDSASFWENHYATADPQWGGKPNHVFGELVVELAPRPGSALDLGCGHGGDAIWLATRGWNVTAVDVSATALRRVDSNADTAGVRERVHTQRHDLSRTFPAGPFDLINATYFHTPVDIDRTAILRRAAAAIAPGGLLIVIEHASTAPWSWRAGQHVRYPTPAEVVTSFELGHDWQQLRCEAPSRVAAGPNGESATVTENVIAMRRDP